MRRLVSWAPSSLVSSPDHQSPALRQLWPVSLAIFVVTLGLYGLGACRTIYVGDSGELATAAATLGIPHPTGYPLYVLLGHLWTRLLPFDSPAFELSLMSAWWGALTVAIFYVVARRQALALVPSLFGAAMLAVAPSFWSQANVQRVYTLNGFFVIAVFGLALEWFRSRRPGFLVGAAWMAGLGACNHTVLGVLGFAIGVFAILAEPELLRRPKTILACVGAGLVGLLPYAYLIIRSRHDPRLDWGDPETLDRFVDVVLRRDFWDRAWLEQPSDWWIILGDFGRSLGDETLWAGAVLALVGVIAGWRRGWPLLALFGMAANVIAMGLHGSRSDLFIWHRYYIAAYVLWILLAALGLHVIGQQLARYRRQRLLALALIVPLMGVGLGWRQHDRSRYRIAEDFSQTLLSTLPPGAHLSASDDNILFVLIYLHYTEGQRPDLNLILQGVGHADLPELRFDPDSDPLFFTHHPNWNHPQIDVVPVGLVFQTVRRDAPLPPVTLPKLRLDGEDDARVPKDYLTRNLIGHFHFMIGSSYEQRDWSRAARAFERAAAQAPDNDVLHYNLGLIYRRNGQLARARAAFERAAEINPRRLASDKPARAVDRLAEVEAELDRVRPIERELASHPSLRGLETGGPAYHLAKARLWAARGERSLEHGERLRAQETRREKSKESQR